jgi:hypothetical protein
MDWVRNPNKRQFLMIAAIVLLVMFYFRGCQKQAQLKDEMKRQELVNAQNIRALNDSVRYMKNRAGELEAVKSSFVTKVEDLEKLNNDLYSELKKEIGTVKSLVKAGVGVDRGEITISNDLVRYPDGKTYGLTFKDTYADSALVWNLRGESKFKLDNNTIFSSTTTIFENNMKVKLVMGFKENKDNYEVWARSGSPLVKFNDLDGVILIPKKPDLTTPVAKKKRFGIGPQIGFGIGSDLRGNMKIGPFIGIGLSYDPIQF